MPTLWYFAYGSNMQSATLRGRRGVDYQRAVPVIARGWRLVFDKPPIVSVPLMGSAANIVPDIAAETPGVAFEIDAEDLAHIELTEGVLIGNYDRVEVRVSPLGEAAAAPLTALSLSSGRRDPHLLPSTRYMTLVIAGAVEHGLPADHIAYLRGIRTATEGPEAKELWALIDDALWRRRGD
jgi:hypothetical protein